MRNSKSSLHTALRVFGFAAIFICGWLCSSQLAHSGTYDEWLKDERSRVLVIRRTTVAGELNQLLIDYDKTIKDIETLTKRRDALTLRIMERRNQLAYVDRELASR